MVGNNNDNYKIGDLVTVITEKATEEGVLMPSAEEDVVIIKLDTGYNIGFNKKDITEIKLLKKKEIKEAVQREPSKKEGLPVIAVLHTGGTIASKVDYSTGGVIAKFSAADLVEMVPEIENIANIETEIVSNLMSEDIMLKDYARIAEGVKKYAEKGVKGIIIGHGTDTLAYTAAALSFMFDNLNIPVLLVGSQRSPDRGSSDAAMNLICAAEFIAQTNFVGVATCLHHTASDDKCAIINGTRSRKMHTSRRDAFQAINDSPIALVDYRSRKVEYLKEGYCNREDSGDEKKEFILKSNFSDNVALMKTSPNISPKQFQFFTENYEALVIEGTGLGHAPTNIGENLKNFEFLKKFIKNGGIVAITSQCLFGQVHPYVYTNLRRLHDIGCIFCKDMIPETTYVKLAWLLGNYKKGDVRKLLVENLRGEINDSLSYEDDFVK